MTKPTFFIGNFERLFDIFQKNMEKYPDMAKMSAKLWEEVSDLDTQEFTQLPPEIIMLHLESEKKHFLEGKGKENGFFNLSYFADKEDMKTLWHNKVITFENQKSAAQIQVNFAIHYPYEIWYSLKIVKNKVKVRNFKFNPKTNAPVIFAENDTSQFNIIGNKFYCKYNLSILNIDWFKKFMSESEFEELISIVKKEKIGLIVQTKEEQDATQSTVIFSTKEQLNHDLKKEIIITFAYLNTMKNQRSEIMTLTLPHSHLV